ncbi:MAG: DUF4332 domain-containing protein [Bacteroidales bacterium]|jgi:hypothetical protein|nr:DUF4332 domain-containing protein [Bacteroidales bacterium]MDD2831311.1 DUF4332 domain-containing protein [Bacteroidales bacterium]MDD3208306.1 DUF4332 domain-containing protein [Bacteroidales bacterium]MDD3697011.1 DUF4332 domain-containing protein [Bacteroidales bacterium]MDD4167663.1 DUF4332 domain-containing protein [Bacteroidales bacterium]
MGYYIDLESISLEDFQEKLRTSYVLPSRIILKEKLDERFEYFQKMGINNIQQLLEVLKDKKKLAEIARIDCFSEAYLKNLYRELNSFHPKPNKMKDFQDIPGEVVSMLDKAGIKDTVDLFDKVKTPKNRKSFATETGISNSDLLKLTKLTDLSRIRWVGVMFARILYESGFDTLEKVANADYMELYYRIIQTNKEKNLYKGKIGLNDMRLCVHAAKEVPLEIEYQITDSSR